MDNGDGSFLLLFFLALNFVATRVLVRGVKQAPSMDRRQTCGESVPTYIPSPTSSFFVRAPLHRVFDLAVGRRLRGTHIDESAMASHQDEARYKAGEAKGQAQVNYI